MQTSTKTEFSPLAVLYEQQRDNAVKIIDMHRLERKINHRRLTELHVAFGTITGMHRIVKAPHMHMIETLLESEKPYAD